MRCLESAESQQATPMSCPTGWSECVPGVVRCLESQRGDVTAEQRTPTARRRSAQVHPRVENHGSSVGEANSSHGTLTRPPLGPLTGHDSWLEDGVLSSRPA
jgi:hypothetical protein